MPRQNLCGSSATAINHPSESVNCGKIEPSRQAPRRCREHPGPADWIGVDVPESTCSATGCNMAIRSKGLCALHYQRWLRTGDPRLHPSGRRSQGSSSRVCDRRVRLPDAGTRVVQRALQPMEDPRRSTGRRLSGNRDGNGAPVRSPNVTASPQRPTSARCITSGSRSTGLPNWSGRPAPGTDCTKRRYKDGSAERITSIGRCTATFARSLNAPSKSAFGLPHPARGAVRAALHQMGQARRRGRLNLRFFQPLGANLTWVNGRASRADRLSVRRILHRDKRTGNGYAWLLECRRCHMRP